MTVKRRRKTLFAVILTIAILLGGLYALFRVDSAEYFSFPELGEVSSVYVVRAGGDTPQRDIIDGIMQETYELFLLEEAQKDEFLAFLRKPAYRKRVANFAWYLIPDLADLTKHESIGGTVANASNGYSNYISFCFLLVNPQGETQFIHTSGSEFISVAREDDTVRYLKITKKKWRSELDEILYNGQLLETYYFPIFDKPYSRYGPPFPEGWSLPEVTP